MAISKDLIDSCMAGLQKSSVPQSSVFKLVDSHGKFIACNGKNSWKTRGAAKNSLVSHFYYRVYYTKASTRTITKDEAREIRDYLIGNGYINIVEFILRTGQRPTVII